jgi:hypothetical protein
MATNADVAGARARLAAQVRQTNPVRQPPEPNRHSSSLSQVLANVDNADARRAAERVFGTPASSPARPRPRPRPRNNPDPDPDPDPDSSEAVSSSPSSSSSTGSGSGSSNEASTPCWREMDADGGGNTPPHWQPPKSWQRSRRDDGASPPNVIIKVAEMASSAARRIRNEQGRTRRHQWRQLYEQMADFDTFIDGLLGELTLKSNVLRLKMQSYSGWYDRSQIANFASTSVIALMTATLAIIGGYLVAATPSYNSTDDIHPAIPFSFTITILFISSAAGLLMILVKYRGWKKKADAISTIYRRSMDVMADLPCAQQQLKLVRSYEEFDLLRTSFMAREFKFYMETLRSINEHLSFESQTRHLPDFYNINLRNREDQRAYHQDLLQVLVEERTVERDLQRQFQTPRSTWFRGSR